MKKITELRIGDEIHFKDGSLFSVRSKKDKYLIATTPKTGYEYTIIDTEKEMCGPHDRTFNPYDLTKQEGIVECLEDIVLEKNGLKLSGRHSASVYDVLDLERTLN